LASKLTSLLPQQYQTLRDKLVDAYQALKIEQRDHYTQLHFSDSNLVYQLVKEACYELGFIEIDAQAIAKAWQNKNPSIAQFDLLDWPQDPQLFNIQGTHPKTSFPSCPKNLGLYVVAPTADWIEKLLIAGVKTVQLRFKSEDKEAIRIEVKKAIQIAQQFNCQLFINDFWELAIEYGAYGVHLGQEDLDTADFNLIKSNQLRLGISTHGIAEMQRADQISPSYIALGAIFPTTLKIMPTAPQGLARLDFYTKLLQSYPLVGIGGVDETNLEAVLKCKVGSVAMVRSVINAPDYQVAIDRLQSHILKLQSAY
jgi:thiamine-phosphate pyrophosphorylase